LLEEASDGDEALERLKSGEALPDVLLLDMRMPRVSGPEVLEALKEDPSLARIPVIVLTAGVDTAEHERCRALGAMRVVQKDFGPMCELAAQLGELAESG